MITTDLYNIKGEVVGSVDLSDEIFGVLPNEGLVHEAIKGYLANLRAGTASTKNRGEVSGGGRKPWRQKGTGRARVGSIRSPLRRGGGKVFGPKPRDYRVRLSSRLKRDALVASLSDRFLSGRIMVIDEINLVEPKTKMFVKILKDLNIERPLIVVDTLDRPLLLSSGNIKGVEVISYHELNAHRVMSHEYVLFTLGGIKGLTKRILGDGGSQ